MLALRTALLLATVTAATAHATTAVDAYAGTLAYDAATAALTVAGGHADTRTFDPHGPYGGASDIAPIAGAAVSFTFDFAAPLTDTYAVRTILFPSGAGGRAVSHTYTGTITGITVDVAAGGSSPLHVSLNAGQAIAFTLFADRGYYFDRRGRRTGSAPGLTDGAAFYTNSVDQIVMPNDPRFTVSSSLPDYRLSLYGAPFEITLTEFEPGTGVDFSGTQPYTAPAGDFAGIAAAGFQSAVPEPATWTAMMTGLGAIGWKARRRAPRHAR